MLYMTPAAAAHRLGVQPATVRRWIREGALPASRTPGRNGRGRYRIAESDLVLALVPVRRGPRCRGEARR